MRKVLLFFTSILFCGCSISKPDQPVYGLAERLLPANNSSFVFEQLSSDSDFLSWSRLQKIRLSSEGIMASRWHVG